MKQYIIYFTQYSYPMLFHFTSNIATGKTKKLLSYETFDLHAISIFTSPYYIHPSYETMYHISYISTNILRFSTLLLTLELAKLKSYYLTEYLIYTRTLSRERLDFNKQA